MGRLGRRTIRFGGGVDQPLDFHAAHMELPNWRGILTGRARRIAEYALVKDLCRFARW
jgi:hypothetical protein